MMRLISAPTLFPLTAVMASSIPVVTDPPWVYIPTGNDILENTSQACTCCGLLPFAVDPTPRVI